jgi:hypothetical protein
LDDSFESIRASISEETAPYIDIDLLPEQERDDAKTLNFLRNFLTVFIVEFVDALTLVDHVESDHPQWKMLAAKQGVLSIWQFGETLKLIRKTYSRCPQLKRLLGKHAFKAAQGTFGARFSHIEDARNTGVHLVEHITQKESGKPRSLRNFLVLASSMRGRKFCFYRYDRECCVDISSESLLLLMRIRTMVYRTFRIADQKLRIPGDAVFSDTTSRQDEA